MWNPFKRNKEIKALRSLSTTFAILDSLSNHGVIYWQKSLSHKEESSGALLIEEYFAHLKLAEGERGFKRFLEQVALWQNFRLLQEAYSRRLINVETKAVREAKKKYAVLSKADIHRIRQHARDNMPSLFDEDGNPSLTLIQEFDLFIIRADAPSASIASESNGQLLAIGHWDGKTLEMAMYDDIKHNLQNNE